MNQKIFLCENSTEGIFTGVYCAWESRHPKEFIKLSVNAEGNYELFSEYINVTTDFEKASKVARTIERRFGAEVYANIYEAACSNGADKAEVIFRTINAGLASNNPRKLMENLQDKNICRVFELSRAVGNESHHLLGFVRFRELKNKVLCSVIEPKNDVVALIAPHFADRLPMENWLIYDKGRKLAAVHEGRGTWGIIKSDGLILQSLEQISEEEKAMEELWKGFCSSISIKERENLNLQKQNLPLRFQKDMVEFQK
ncbi:TIGR03915 family putative DNA repair protein [Konateibacter massiliensis]|uniref:TIGR03915 family putative DNA repair protein n=1 Tax=Konateibacter massiliensis TaxID=2002841 RepID=UPI0015D4AEF2|nr:TIGR03915 family putative DNA repair protein [Konateibacter massiliensis]